MTNEMIIFSTREYQRSHFCLPKGRGYWGFEIDGKEFWTTGTFTEAKKNVIAHVKATAPAGYNDFVNVIVLP